MRPMTASRRRRANRLMSGQCVVRRPTGQVVTDPVTKVVTPEYEVIYGPDIAPWWGRCKPQSFRPQERTPNVAEGTYVVISSEVHFPVGAVEIKDGDIVTITKSFDPLLVGRHYGVNADEPTVEIASAYHVPVSRIPDEEVPPWPTPSP